MLVCSLFTASHSIGLRTKLGVVCVPLSMCVSVQGASGELRRNGPSIHSSLNMFPLKGWLLSQLGSGYEGNSLTGMLPWED